MAEINRLVRNIENSEVLHIPQARSSRFVDEAVN